MTLSEELTKLAQHLEDKAVLAEAMAVDHDRNREPICAKQQQKRAANARHYVTVCQHAAKLLKAREKRGAFVKPTFDEVWQYARENLAGWPVLDVQSWYDHFESNGWKVSGKTTMASWQAAARQGYRRWKEKNPQATMAKGDGEPEGWIAFLKQQSITPVHYKYAAAHLKNDFAKWLRQK